MQKQPIAKIRLASGEVGYYDDYSRIYLSVANPEAYIYPGTNLFQIKRSIKSGRLRLIEGSLSEPVVEQPIVTSGICSPKAPEVVVEVKDEATPEEAVPVVEENMSAEVEAAEVEVSEEVKAEEVSVPEEEIAPETEAKPARRKRKPKEEIQTEE